MEHPTDHLTLKKSVVLPVEEEKGFVPSQIHQSLGGSVNGGNQRAQAETALLTFHPSVIPPLSSFPLSL